MMTQDSKYLVTKMVSKFREKMVTSFMDGPFGNINKGRREEEQKLVLQATKHKHFFFLYEQARTLLL